MGVSDCVVNLPRVDRHCAELSAASQERTNTQHWNALLEVSLRSTQASGRLFTLPRQIQHGLVASQCRFDTMSNMKNSTIKRVVSR